MVPALLPANPIHVHSCPRSCSPFVQDLADAEAALLLGFAGSLTRNPTTDAEAPPPGDQNLSAAPPPAQALAPGQQAQQAASLAQPRQPDAVGEDLVAAELAAAQQQIDEEVGGLLPGWGPLLPPAPPSPQVC